MSDAQKTADDIRAAVAENLKQAKSAADNFFEMIEKSLSTTSMPVAEHTKVFRDFLRHSVESGFDLSNKLLAAKDVQEVVRIQSEFFQSQFGQLTEQARTLSENAVKAAQNAFKMPSGS